MTKIKVCYCILLAAALVFYISFIDLLSLIILITAAVFPAFLLIAVKFVCLNTDISFYCEKTAEAKNIPVMCKARLRNNTFLPLSRIHLKIKYKNCMDNQIRYADILVPLHAMRHEEVDFSLCSEFCGKIIAVLDEVVFYDYIMLFKSRKKTDISTEILILPQIHDIDAFICDDAFCSGDNEIYSQSTSGDDPSEIFSMREYLPGDRMTQIHWKLSSKQEELVVKEYSKPINANVLLLFDFNVDQKDKELMKKLDTLAETLVSISDFMINEQTPHYVGFYNAADSRFERCLIMSAADGVLMARKVLGLFSYPEPYALKYFDSEYPESQYSHIIYATSDLNPDQSKMLDAISQKHKVSLIVAGKSESEMFGSQSDLINKEYPVYCVEYGKIGDCLTELVI